MDGARISASLESAAVAVSDWTAGLPLLAGTTLTLREVQIEDAQALVALLTTEEVSRFIWPPPSSVEAVERFILWMLEQRQAGKQACFVIVPAGMRTAVGLFQVRALERGFATAEWGFALGSRFWGSGLFAEGARLFLDFSFDVIGVHRLEARAAAVNGRGNGALRKIGAVQEGVLRSSVMRDGAHHDNVLWGMLADDWRLQRRLFDTDQPY